MLIAAASIGLAAKRLTTLPQAGPSARGGGARSPNISEFVSRELFEPVAPKAANPIRVDPFSRSAVQAGESRDEFPVASRVARPTVASAGDRSLTAILIADDRRVAVIDDITVGVGDVLRGGARVSRIQPDRVWLVERDGRWSSLTLTNRGQ